MAAKPRTTNRNEKRVLSTQAIERGRSKNSGSIRPANEGGGFARDIFAVFTFVGSVGILLALWTYHREDVAGAKVDNLIGPAGHKLAKGLFGVGGLCAYLVPVTLFYTSLALFVRGKGRRRGRQIAGLVALALSGAILSHLVVGPTSWLQYPPGGAIGMTLGEMLRGVLSTVGAVLVMLATAAGALIVATDSAFARLCVTVGRYTAQGAVIGWHFSVEQAKRGFAAFLAWREQRKREKAEENAAFAQAMADAEEAESGEMDLHDLDADFADHDAITQPPTPNDPITEESEAYEQHAADEHEPERYDEAPAAPESDDEALAAEAAEVAEEAARIAREAEERKLQQLAEQKAKEAALRAARRARNAPIADPAWVMAPPEGTTVAAAETKAEAPAVEAKPVEEKPRQLPIINLPPVPTPTPPAPVVAEAKAAAPAVVEPAPAPVPAPAIEAKAEPEAKPEARLAVPPVAEEKKEPIVAVSPVLPLIVEPKAPPKPSKLDPFAFEGESHFSLPPIDLLETPPNRERHLDKEVFYTTADKLKEKLASFGITGEVKEIRPGPVVTMYEFVPSEGIRISKIANLADDLAMAMEALKVRIIAPIPGKGAVGIEVPNKDREDVNFREIVEQDAFTKASSKIAMAIGKNIEGQPYVTDLAKMPHLLIAGTTGSGKSVSVNAMIMSVLFKATPEEVRMIMVDPKVTELSIYEGIPHLLLPVVTDPRKAAMALRWAVEEMERRYQLLAEAGVRNIGGYNKWVEKQQGVPQPPPPKPVEAATETGRKLRIIDVDEGESEEDALARVSTDGSGATLGVAAPNPDEADAAEAQPPTVVEAPAEALEAQPEEPVEAKEPPKKLPYIVIVIDEVADLMMVAAKEVETYVARLAQMARAAGIHLMIATQRPSTDVITGVIKANFPSRISFQLRSKPDSMTILGCVGAEALLGRGDMLILPPTSANLERVHGAYVSDNEIQKVVAHLKAQGKPVYDESILKPREEEGGDGEGDEGSEDIKDEAYDQCLALVSTMQVVSVSMLQRKLRLGYNRAARIIEQMEREGIVGPANGSKPREVLIRPVGEMHKEVNL